VQVVQYQDERLGGGHPSSRWRTARWVRPTLASCRYGGHAIWWSVDAASATEALRLLPFYVAQRADVTRVDEVEIP
jgi:hypothetical protein